MADIKISELGAAQSVSDTDVFPMTSSGVTVKAPASKIKDYLKTGNLTSLTTDSKTSLVSAINEVDSHADTAQSTANAANTKATDNRQMIAPIQSTLTASKAYAVGEQFVYNGHLYKATAAIAQGGTITIDGNCTLADSVTEQIGNIKDTLDANNLGTAVNLASYTTTLYTCPSDGYAFCSCGATADARAALSIYGNTGTVYMSIGGRGNSTYASWSCFVKKGMRIKVDELANNGLVRFMPLV